MAAIKLPDGSHREIPDGSSVMQLAESIGKGLAKAAIAGRVDGKLVDLSSKLTGRREVSIVTDRDPDGLYIMRHSTAHVLAQALRNLYGPSVQYTIGPVIENGFFYDFELPPGFSVDQLPMVEQEMQRVIDANLSFSREDVDPARAKELLHGENQRFKDEIIDELAQAGEKSVSIYRQGNFTDLCRGPHVPSTGKIKSFKLMSLAGAYWRGDSNRQQLTRIYGTAFFDKKDLENHLKLLDEAKKTRSPRPRQATEPLHHQPPGGQRTGAVDAQRRGHSLPVGNIPPPGIDQAGIQAGLYPPHRKYRAI